MKKLYEKNLVINIYEGREFSYEELLQLLGSDDFEEKHFALTFINSLKKPEDIDFFIQNLTGQDTKIRELASFRVNDFICEDNSLMEFLDNNPEVVINTICDINPQVCRNICQLLPLSAKKPYFIAEIIQKLADLTEKTQKIKFKTHKVSKDVFNLYWNFFALENLIDGDFSQMPELAPVLALGVTYKDYTIRERVAFMVKKLQAHGFDEVELIFEKLQKDENFYVKKALG